MKLTLNGHNLDPWAIYIDGFVAAVTSLQQTFNGLVIDVANKLPAGRHWLRLMNRDGRWTDSWFDVLPAPAPKKKKKEETGSVTVGPFL